MPFATSWEVQAAAGAPRAAIRVRNLQATLGAAAGQDAWGRSGRPQPALLSAEVVLASAFDVAAGTDRVAADTVHYGTLSKAILKSVAQWERPAEAGAGPASLADVVDGIWIRLAGHPVGRRASSAALQPAAPAPAALLDVGLTRRLTVSVLLPKASLVGEGVSLTTTAAVALPEGSGRSGRSGAIRGAADSPFALWSTALRLHRLRVPTLVGVHPHERTAKQAVVADVTLDAYAAGTDRYAELEALVVRTMESSAFETLEALATCLARTILTEFPANAAAGVGAEPLPSGPSWQVHVSLEKPIAVPFADAPVVEVRMGFEDL